MGVTIVNKDSYIAEILGQYILQFITPSSVQTLKSEGLTVKHASSAFNFSYVKTAMEHEQFLKLPDDFSHKEEASVLI
jgi:hypothetical protein